MKLVHPRYQGEPDVSPEVDAQVNLRTSQRVPVPGVGHRLNWLEGWYMIWDIHYKHSPRRKSELPILGGMASSLTSTQK